MKRIFLAMIAASLMLAFSGNTQAQVSKNKVVSKSKTEQKQPSKTSAKNATKLQATPESKDGKKTTMKEMFDSKKKLAQYATYPLKCDVGELSRSEQELLVVLIQIADIIDDIYWEQACGRETLTRIRKTENRAAVEYAQINYGPWDRLDDNKPFIPGFGPKPAGANFYPQDMTQKEFDAIKDPMKTSPYTMLRRNAKGGIDVVPYSKAFDKQLILIDKLLDKAINLAENDGMRKYLEMRREALRNDDYLESDMVWMDMKDSRLDFVFGPIENYEDALYGYKTAFEAFVLLKDEEWSKRLSVITDMLPELQDQLPCDSKYKKEKPGLESDINVYDVLYYAGECNAGGKTIAINLPNDEKVQLKKGTRRLQLKNAMQAKFDMILQPIAQKLLCKEQIPNVKFEAFFNNVCNHEVAHGLGVKNVVKGKGTVREALKNQYSAWEEAKADICGLYIVQTLIEKGVIKDVTVEDAYVTYVASLLRSVRFGATEAHGIANIMCFNYMQDNGAISHNKEGRYVVDAKKMRSAIEGWASFVLQTEGDGDYEAAKKYAEKNGVVRAELARELRSLEADNIPVDIRFEQGTKYLGLEMFDDRRGPVRVIDDKHIRPR